MELKNKINLDYNEALKAKDKTKISTYRLILSSIKDLEPGESLYFDKFSVFADSKFENSFHDSEKFYLYWVERIID